MAQAVVMDRLDQALNRESYEWLLCHQPDILSAVEAEVNAGRSPDQIRLHVIRKTSRVELAQRCEQAAHHVRAITVER